MEPEVLSNIIGVTGTLVGVVIGICANRYIPTRSDILKEKEKNKRIKDIVEKIPDQLWINDDDSVFPNSKRPLNRTTREIQGMFFSGENLSIDEVYDILKDLQEKELMRIVSNSKHKKTTLWQSRSRDDVWSSIKVDDTGVRGYYSEQ